MLFRTKVMDALPRKYVHVDQASSMMQAFAVFHRHVETNNLRSKITQGVCSFSTPESRKAHF